MAVHKGRRIWPEARGEKLQREEAKPLGDAVLGDGEWSSSEMPFDEVLDNKTASIEAETLPLPRGGDLPPKELAIDSLAARLTVVGLEPAPKMQIAHRTRTAAARQANQNTAESIDQRIREFAEKVLAEKEEVKPSRREIEAEPWGLGERFWDKLQADSGEAERSRQEQLERMDMLVPDFVLNNLEKLEDGQTRFWREQGTVAVLDLSGFTRLAEAAVKREDWTRSGSGSQRLNETITKFFGQVHTEATAAGGELVSLGGDEVVYVFLDDAHQERALHFVSRAKELTTEHPEGINLAGGVASGDLLLGAVRLDAKRSLPLVLGEPLVKARELQDVASRGDVMVHSAVAPALRAGGMAIERDSGVAVEHYDNLEAVGEYWQEHKKNYQPLSPTFETIATAARFLHPYHRYVAEFEGVRPNLYDGERLPMTVMFIDVGIDALHQQVTREVKDVATSETSEAVSKLEKVLQEVNASIRKHHGNFEKLMLADANSKIMALFTKDRKEANALRCAKEAQNILQDNGITSAVGIYSGTGYRGITGPIGSGEPQVELGVIAVEANNAYRLSGHASRGEVLADSSTVMQAENVLRIDKLGALSQKALGLKGIERERIILQVGRVENMESTLEHVANVRPVGREKQKEQMREAFTEMADSGKQIVEMLVAESGEGKSLLTDEMVREHYYDKCDAAVIKGKAQEFGEEEVYGLWKVPARKLFGIEGNELPVAALEKISAKLAEVDPKYIQYAGLFAEEFELAAVSVPADQHFPGFGAKAAEVFTALMVEQSREMSLVAVFEDLHWADHASKELLKQVIANTKDERILYHLVARPQEGLVEFFRLDESCVRKIELGPLGSQYWADFIATQFPIGGIKKFAEYRREGDDSWRGDRTATTFKLMRANERLTDISYRLSNGNPYVGRAVIRYLLNYHDIYSARLNPRTGKPFQFFDEREGIYYFADYISEDLLSDAKDLGNAYEQMFGSLSSGKERVAVKFASKLGREFKDTELADLLGVAPQGVNAFLEHWERLGWIERGAETYSFAHANIQEAIEKNIAEVVVERAGGRMEQLDNETLSRLVGEYKEKRGGRLEDLARLFGASDDVAKGMRYNLRLGDVALSRQDAVSYRLAMNAYWRTIAMFENNFMPEAAGDDEQEGLRRAAAWETLPKKDKAELVTDLLQAHSRLVKTHSRTGMGTGNIEEALRVTDKALEYLNRFGGVLNKDIRGVTEAEVAVMKMDQLYRANRIPEAAGLTQQYESLVKRMEQGLERDNESYRGDARKRILLANYYNARGLITRRSERPRDAWQYYAKALELVGPDDGFEELDVWDRVADNRIRFLEADGRHQEARQLLQELLAKEEKKNFKAGIVATKIMLAEELGRGTKEDVHRAKTILYDVLELVRDHAPARELSVYLALVNLEEMMHNYGAAYELIERVIPMVGGVVGKSTANLRVNGWKAELAFLAMKRGEATLAQAIKQEIPMEGLAGREAEGTILLVEGMEAVNESDYSKAEGYLQQSFEIFRNIPGSITNAAQALVEYALLERKRGNLLAARQKLEGALGLYENESVEQEYVRELIKEIS